MTLDIIPAYVQERFEEQVTYCIKNNTDILCPHDGDCFFCGKQIFDKITKEEASTTHIIGCPWCKRSYAE